MTDDPDIPFSIDDWVTELHNPGRQGQWTGRTSNAGPINTLEILYPDGNISWRPLTALVKMTRAQETLAERFIKGRFGRAKELRRVITYEKLKGTLHEVIYSMEAAQIDFYAYQFKPVMKLISAPTERLILADEVGLGKTIEAALVWLELQARRQAKRLLVVCPKTLAEKWKDELAHKFLLDSRIVDFNELRGEVKKTQQRGPSHAFTLIATYTGLRPPREKLYLLNSPPGEGGTGSEKTEFLRGLRHDMPDYEPFDMVIFDEAHYMRNPGSTTFRLGEALSACAGAVLCVSATPVNNSNKDLHSLLRLVDESFFESQELFDELLEANRPAVQAGNALERLPVDKELLDSAIRGMGRSPFISSTPLFKEFAAKIGALDPNNKAELAKCQSIAESLNLLGGYVNRTRRVQVKEKRAVRSPLVLTVDYSPEERQLYNMILNLVRQRCKLDSRPFHVFQVLGLQLRAASCLPVLAQEIREGRFGDPEELMAGAFDEDTLEELFEDSMLQGLQDGIHVSLARHDFEKYDIKYRELSRLLTVQLVNEKIVIFAFYRPTLSYLQRRLNQDGVSVAMIHGGVSSEQRWSEIDRFKDPNGPRILLSSEVGSEGIDLQFCRTIVNYDLPWNPMRVEQRIGRIDRVGQKADKLVIVNFKVRDTIEERLYDRLHMKLAIFSNSLGDLEAIIGKEVQQLTTDLLSKDLSPDEENARIARAENVIETHAIMIRKLEDSSDSLLALSDYLQRRIDEVKGKGRFMQAEEIEDYVTDFFSRNYQGCEVISNTPAQGCLRFRLSAGAHASLAAFIHDDQSPSAQVLRQKEFAISFRRDVMQAPATQRHKVYFMNHLCPLVRWITKENQEQSHAMFNVSALTLGKSSLPLGTYAYLIERWKMVGLSSRECLAYAVMGLSNGLKLNEGDAEDVIQSLLRHGKDWDYAVYNQGSLQTSYEELENELSSRFNSLVTEFDAENTTTIQIRRQRVINFFDRRIEQAQERINGLGQLAKPQIIKMAQGRLQKAQENKKAKLDELEGKTQIDVEQSPIAAGIFRVV